MTHDVCGDQQGDGFADDTAQYAALRSGEIVNPQTRDETLDLFLAPKMAEAGLIATAFTAWLKPRPPDAR
jgi:hypothetical protein